MIVIDMPLKGHLYPRDQEVNECHMSYDVTML